MGSRQGWTRAVVAAAVDAEELDGAAHLAGHAHVLAADAADPLDENLPEVHELAGGQRGQDGELVRGVDRVDVEGGVRLGVAELLGVGQHGLEVLVLLEHAGEDVVAGAVDDAADLADLAALEGLLHGADDGDAPAHGRFELQADALLRGDGEELGAVLGDERLVGGHHVLAGAQRGGDPAAGHFVAAHQLHQDLDRGVGDQLVGVRGRPVAAGGEGGGLLLALGAEAADFDVQPELGGEIGDSLFQDFDGSGTDGYQTDDADADGHGWLRGVGV